MPISKTVDDRNNVDAFNAIGGSASESTRLPALADAWISPSRPAPKTVTLSSGIVLPQQLPTLLVRYLKRYSSSLMLPLP
jgi:hypothetical protein